MTGRSVGAALGALLVGCTSGPGSGQRLDLEMFGIDRAANAAVREITLTDQADRRRAILAAAPAGTVALIADSALPDSAGLVRRVGGIVDSLWPRRPRDSSLRLVVAVYRPRADRRDPRRWRDRAAFAGTLMPDLTDGRTCLTTLPVQLVRQRAEGPGLEQTVADAVAPCLWLARYGRPGPAVAAWLERTNYLALTAPPALSPHAVLREMLRTRWDPGLADQGLYDLPFWARAVAKPVALSTGRWMPPYYAGPASVRCLAGRESSCLVALEQRDLASWLPPWTLPDGEEHADVVPLRLGFDWSANPMTASRWFVTLLHYGTEAEFEAFWTGRGTLAEAYQAAYGVPLDQALSTWARHDWQAASDSPPIRLGVPIEAGDVWAVLSWGLLFLVLPLVAARAREAGG